MELKPTEEEIVQRIKATNRTIMELKRIDGYDGDVWEYATNRTIMELKLPSKTDKTTKKALLIAPLWN